MSNKSTKKSLMIYICSNINNIHKNYHINIFNLLKKENDDFKYTQNKNGIFIDLTTLNIDLLQKIKKIIDYSKLQKANNKKRQLQKKNLMLLNSTT
tara:strand:+ start:535 stop:822 length:288 start_codon:yes stop_codon:yes gene_type:complete